MHFHAFGQGEYLRGHRETVADLWIWAKTISSRKEKEFILNDA